MESLLAAVVQLCSTDDLTDNMRRLSALCERAAARGARLVVLPENFALMSDNERAKLGIAASVSDPTDALVGPLRRLAMRLGVDLVLGGFPERAPTAGRVFNTSAYIRATGELALVYRKIHLFDVDFAAANTVHRESATVEPGRTDQVPVIDTPFGRIGLSICYDLRFPEFYRRLAESGTHIVTVPAAFTLHTGKDHWHVLLRARAIENQCFVLAAAQSGRHGATRMTYGHAMIVDPWGTVLAECPDGEGIALAELNMGSLQRIRQSLPALLHRRIDTPTPT